MGRPSKRPRPIPGGVTNARQGLTEAQVAHQLEVQGYACMICTKPLGLEWAADHDHALAETHGHDPRRGCSRCFRALLCKACNLMLGWSRDDPEVLERGADYLRAVRHG